jgi:manganese/zinc/iron transport system permease protein
MIAAVFDSIPAMILLAGALVAAAAVLPGVFLVLRGSAMLTDAISHSIVLGIVLVWLVTGQLAGPLQLIGAGLAGLATVLGAEALARSRLVRTDAAIGLVFPAMFALGVLLIGLFARDVHLDVETVLLGEIGFVWLETTPVAGVEVPVTVRTLAAMAAINLGFVLAFWKELKLAVFDTELAAALGFAPGAVMTALLALTSATAVAAFDAVGVVLFLAFVVVPPATARLLTDRLGLLLLIALALALASVLSGYALARLWDVSIGGMMAVMTGAFFAAALVAAPREGLVAQALHRRAQRIEHDCAALVAHLATHTGTASMAEENTGAALTGHLRWRPARARAAVLRGLDRGLIARQGDRLVLRPKGAAMARDLPEGNPPRA